MNLIDNAVWYSGPVSNSSTLTDSNLRADLVYKNERNNSLARACTYSECTDTVKRTHTWTGLVGLPYLSDWAYATDGYTTGRNACLGMNLFYASHTNPHGTMTGEEYGCVKIDNWFHQNIGDMSLLSVSSNTNSIIYYINNFNEFTGYYAAYSRAVMPTVYLKAGVKITGGTGIYQDPYTIRID